MADFAKQVFAACYGGVEFCGIQGVASIGVIRKRRRFTKTENTAALYN